MALTLFNSQYYDPSAITAPKLLLLDEPDAFLHPKMVVKMYNVLKVFSENFSVKIIITTHSPTTVALSPENSTFMVCSNNVISITKDEGIAELLDGITQISINPENRRQVYVESQYDADVYQAIFSKLVHNSELVDSKISLNFVSSGPKMPEQQIIEKARKYLI
ncbi:AAA family ATPase [Aeromonas sp. 603696]|uniref:AAA family ATPase n=1 Tax=unclassified Aeromonas TaxID=257493 RepID=UPI003B9FCD72